MFTVILFSATLYNNTEWVSSINVFLCHIPILGYYVQQTRE